MGDAEPLSLAGLPHHDLDHRTVEVRTMRLAEIHRRAEAARGTRPQRLPAHLLALITAGRAEINVDFQRYPCRPGGLLWVRPGQLLMLPPPGLDATLVLFPDVLVPSPPTPADVYWEPVGEDEEAIVDAVSQLETDYERSVAGEPIPAELLRHQLAALLLRVVRLAGSPTPAGEREVFARFRDEIESRYAGCRQVDAYARSLGCSVRTLTRASLAATGRTAKQLIDDRVALEAKRMLAHSDLPVVEIGARLGFPEPTNFGRFFTRTVGRSPGQFRAAPC